MISPTSTTASLQERYRGRLTSTTAGGQHHHQHQVDSRHTSAPPPPAAVHYKSSLENPPPPFCDTDGVLQVYTGPWVNGGYRLTGLVNGVS